MAFATYLDAQIKWAIATPAAVSRFLLSKILEKMKYFECVNSISEVIKDTFKYTYSELLFSGGAEKYMDGCTPHTVNGSSKKRETRISINRRKPSKGKFEPLLYQQENSCLLLLLPL